MLQVCIAVLRSMLSHIFAVLRFIIPLQDSLRCICTCSSSDRRFYRPQSLSKAEIRCCENCHAPAPHHLKCSPVGNQYIDSSTDPKSTTFLAMISLKYLHMILTSVTPCSIGHISCNCILSRICEVTDQIYRSQTRSRRVYLTLCSGRLVPKKPERSSLLDRKEALGGRPVHSSVKKFSHTTHYQCHMPSSGTPA